MKPFLLIHELGGDKVLIPIVDIGKISLDPRKNIITIYMHDGDYYEEHYPFSKRQTIKRFNKILKIFNNIQTPQQIIQE